MAGLKVYPLNMRIETARLVLREWEPDDLPLIAAINLDPYVSEFFPVPLTPELSRQAVARYQAMLVRDGFGCLAAELKASGEVIGIIGMQTITLEIPGLPRPAVELGWRLAHAHWGKGLAVEGANAVIQYAFAEAKLTKLFAVTAALNKNSRRVMTKLGMHQVVELDFDHPLLAEGHELRKHVVYLLEAADANKR